jgi:transcriptional regulator with XRE-family HTH domain
MRRKEPTTLFGRRLREARLRAGVPQDRLGVRIGLDESTASARMSRYETGENEPPFGTAVKLARALCLPAAYFYCEDNELADLMIAWQGLTKADRNHIKALVDAAASANRWPSRK